MRPGKALVLLGIAGAIAVLPYVRVNAQACCDPWGVPASTAFIAAGTAVISTLTASVESISVYLKLQMEPTWSNGFAGAMEYIDKQTAAQRTFAQGRIAVTTDLYMANVRGQAKENGIAPAQLDETVTNAVLMSDQIRQARVNGQREDRLLADSLRSFAIAPGDPISRHVAYCNATDRAAGVCTELPPSSVQNADLLVTTITNPGDGQYETMSDDEVAAGRAFIRNIVAPMPLRGVAGDSAQAQHAEALLLADQAVLSIAGHSLNSVMLHRMRKRSGEGQ